MKQLFYKYITQPLANFIDNLNVEKQLKLHAKRKILAARNHYDYIKMVSTLLTEQDFIKYQDDLTIEWGKYLIDKNVRTAEQMFWEKKNAGDFDELNILIK